MGSRNLQLVRPLKKGNSDSNPEHIRTTYLRNERSCSQLYAGWRKAFGCIPTLHVGICSAFTKATSKNLGSLLVAPCGGNHTLSQHRRRDVVACRKRLAPVFGSPVGSSQPDELCR